MFDFVVPPTAALGSNGFDLFCGFHIVLGTIPNGRFGSVFGMELNWNCWNGFNPIRKPNCTAPTVFWAVSLWLQLSI
jgi:hypothetical protein